MSFQYSVVSPESVDTQKRLLADVLLTHVCGELGLRNAPELRWIVPSPNGPICRPINVAGFARHGDGIYIRADLSLELMAKTVIHELRHVRQFADMERAGRSLEAMKTQRQTDYDEKQATEYEDRFGWIVKAFLTRTISIRS